MAMVCDVDHPLVRNLRSYRGKKHIYVHRFVLYEHLRSLGKENDLSCAMCSTSVSWDNLHVDHIDCDKKNNVAENLRVSCALCNLKRSREQAIATKRSKGRLLTKDGVTKCVSEWAREIGLRSQSLNFRLNAGWSVERALSEGRGKTGPKRKIKTEDVKNN